MKIKVEPYCRMFCRGCAVTTSLSLCKDNLEMFPIASWCSTVLLCCFLVTNSTLILKIVVKFLIQGNCEMPEMFRFFKTCLACCSLCVNVYTYKFEQTMNIIKEISLMFIFCILLLFYWFIFYLFIFFFAYVFLGEMMHKE